MTGWLWTPKLIEERFEEAADTLRRLPEDRVQGYFSTWPSIVRDTREAYGWDDVRVRMPPPAPDAIDRMDETFTWLPWLEPDDARLVWARAKGTRWKEICWRFGVGRTTAWERWVAALCVIASRLNGDVVPQGASRRRAFAKTLRRGARRLERARG